MRADLRLRHRKALLLAGWIAVSMLSGHDPRVLAQEPALRWDGLIELISGRHDYPPPTTMPPTPADGPSQMSRHAISGDGRYIVFTAVAPSLGYPETSLYLRDRRSNDTRVLLAGPALDPVISGDGNHVAFRVCEPYMRPDNAPICDVWSLDLRTWAWQRHERDAGRRPRRRRQRRTGPEPVTADSSRSTRRPRIWACRILRACSRSSCATAIRISTASSTSPGRRNSRSSARRTARPERSAAATARATRPKSATMDATSRSGRPPPISCPATRTADGTSSVATA